MDTSKEITFVNLPFVPVVGQVIYVEPKYDDRLNRFICENYAWLQDMFYKRGLQFCYLPLLKREVVGYHAPFKKRFAVEVKESSESIIRYVGKGAVDCPMLVFAPCRMEDNATHTFILKAVSINVKCGLHLVKRMRFKGLADCICRCTDYKSLCDEIGVGRAGALSEEKYGRMPLLGEAVDVERSMSLEKSERKPSVEQNVQENCDDERFGQQESEKLEVRYCLRLGADDAFEYESSKLIEEIRQRLEALRARGVNTMFLHDLIDEDEKLSHVLITRDNRIVLTDYDNVEIKMPALTKAVFFLFLRHPEGIRFKELPGFRDELLMIYRKIGPVGSSEKQMKSVEDVTNPLNNSINEKCARIRQAFVAVFDEHLAKNYFVTGKRGEPKCITLPRNLIKWEK